VEVPNYRQKTGELHWVASSERLLTVTLKDDDLPGYWREADLASLAGQLQTLLLARVRFGGLLLAALGGVLDFAADPVNLAALLIAAGFATALVAEVTSWVAQPERDWYAGRALAESAKTLAWRYAVCADPFPVEMPVDQARALLTQRIAEVSQEASDRVTVRERQAVITPAMERLRMAAFEDRKAAYVEDRTRAQQRWYADKADANKRAGTRWRLFLIGGEVLSLGLAAARVFGDWEVDLAGFCAALIASAAAWATLKQFTTLAAAYSTTAGELAIQAARLDFVKETEWPVTVADAEEAISREHTLWLASRTSPLPAR
jgi:hypothetical protein